MAISLAPPLASIVSVRVEELDGVRSVGCAFTHKPYALGIADCVALGLTQLCSIVPALQQQFLEPLGILCKRFSRLERHRFFACAQEHGS
ncbi:protein of unknown function [Ectopseudomonas oleovorans]|nr:protein of unknown function [Pseudomonas oleovorans]